jgi:hypothetical protein
MIRLEENPFPDKEIPFVLVQYLPRRRHPYGESDGVLIEDNQKVLGAVTRGMLDILGRSANGQMGVRKDALDVVNFRKFEKGEDFKFNPNIDPRMAFWMMTYPEIPRSALEMRNIMNEEAESLTGVKSFNQGISGQSLGNVATSVRGALDAASKRELGILRRLSDGMVKIGKKILAMNAVFLPPEKVIRISQDQYKTIKRDDLAGDFDLKVTVATAEIQNQRAQELAFMLQTIGNSVPFDITKMILSEIARLRNMPALSKSLADYTPKPDPMAQQIQQLEMMKLQAEIEKLRAEAQNELSKAQENAIDGQKKMAEARKKMAETRKIGSEADIKDLEFLERNYGVDHNRELEKLGMQQQTQQQVEAMKLLGNLNKNNNSNQPTNE